MKSDQSFTAYGLLGRTLGHSYSPQIHRALGNNCYSLFEVEPHDLDDFFALRHLRGLNITIPYKVNALEACDFVDPVAQAIGAVNTMVRRNGKWHGYNTDCDGFLYMLDSAHISVTDKNCLILGDGATSKTVAAALDLRKAKTVIKLSRHRTPTYDDIAKFYNQTDILINTTPVGMYPNAPQSIVDISHFTKLEGVVDVVYNPARTGLALQADRYKIPYTTGLTMLVAQAVFSAQYFMGLTFPPSTIPSICKSIQKDLCSITLIGMPGCGKTSIAEALAKLMNRPLFDCDTLLTAEIDDISHYISHYGESAFRATESAMLAKLGLETGAIISTGGGAVTQAENYDYLRENSRVYYITRPLEDLDVAGRILSQGGLERLQHLYNDRHPRYEAWSDVVIVNEDIEAAAQAIKEDFDAYFGN